MAASCQRISSRATHPIEVEAAPCLNSRGLRARSPRPHRPQKPSTPAINLAAPRDGPSRMNATRHPHLRIVCRWVFRPNGTSPSAGSSAGRPRSSLRAVPFRRHILQTAAAIRAVSSLSTRGGPRGGGERGGVGRLTRRRRRRRHREASDPVRARAQRARHGAWRDVSPGAPAALRRCRRVAAYTAASSATEAAELCLSGRCALSGDRQTATPSSAAHTCGECSKLGRPSSGDEAHTSPALCEHKSGQWQETQRFSATTQLLGSSVSACMPTRPTDGAGLHHRAPGVDASTTLRNHWRGHTGTRVFPCATRAVLCCVLRPPSRLLI